MKSSIKALRNLRITASKWLLPVIGVVLLCGTDSAHAAGRGNHGEQPLHVVTTIAPLYALTSGVMGDVAEPYLLMKQDDSPHHYTLKPQDAQHLMAADVVICISRDFENYLNPLMDALPERRKNIIEALQIPGMSLVDRLDVDTASRTADNSYIDMHFWLNPDNAIAYTQYIAEILAEKDAENANAYANNAAAQIARLQTLNRTISEMLGSGKKTLQAQYASYHSSLLYFERHYNITGGKAITRTPEAGASVIEADRLNDNIANGGLRCLFQEPEFSPRLLQQMAERHGDAVKLITLDSLGSTYELSPAMYDDMMLDLAAAISQCVETP